MGYSRKSICSSTSMYQSIMQQLLPGCRDAGLDLLQPFRVKWYNDTVEAEHRLLDLNRDDALGVLIGNTKAIWPRFIQWLQADKTRLSLDNPLNSYVVQAIERALASVQVASGVRWAHIPEPHHVAFQKLAEIAGLAFLSPGFLSVHPVYGSWIAFRAVVVLDATGPLAKPPSIVRPCPDCGNACGRALSEALVAVEDAVSRNQAIADQWRVWLGVRDACPVGKNFRYSNEQILYHYTKNRQVLKDAVAEALHTLARIGG